MVYNRDELYALLADDELTRFTPNTIVNIDDIYDELQNIKNRGWEVDNEEYEYNVSCLAAPVYNYENRIEAAIGISGPKIRLEESSEKTGSVIRDVSRRLSSLLGFQLK